MPDTPDARDSEEGEPLWPSRIGRSVAMTAAIIVLGSTGGLMLGRYAVGDADWSGSRLEAATTISAPDSSGPSEIAADMSAPEPIVCTGCGPGIRELQAMEERDRIERMIAAGRDDFSDYADAGDGTGYGHDAFGNIYYDGSGIKAMPPERSTAVAPPVVRTAEVRPASVTSAAPAARSPIATSETLPAATDPQQLSASPVSAPAAMGKD